VLLPLVLAGVAACGGAELPPPKAPPPPPPARLAKKLDASLAALSLPDELVLAGRWKNPSALLAELGLWSGGASPLERWLLSGLGDPSRPIDLGAPIEPIELIVVLDEPEDDARPLELSWAVSLGLGVAPGGPAPPPAEPSDVSSALGLACAESRALGPAPMRMVCAVDLAARVAVFEAR
jgi:hypothetical protein